MKILRIVPQNMRISQLRRPNIEDGLANFEDLTLIFEEKLKTASCAGSPYQDTHYTINKTFFVLFCQYFELSAHFTWTDNFRLVIIHNSHTMKNADIFH